MSEATVASASELLGGTPPPKKQRPPLPPGIKVKPVRPGATWGIHPVDGLGIRLSDAIALETPGETPLEEPTPPPPPPPAPAPAPAPEPLKESAGAPPDFSDLPSPDGGSQPGPGNEGKQPTQDEILTAYAQMAVMFWDSIVRLMCALFGDLWLPKTPDERKMVLDAIVGWMNSIAMAAFTPLENLWMAIGLYSMPRLPGTVQKIISWFKSRKEKKRQRPNESENTGGEKTVDVEAEVMSRGPGI